MNEAQCRRLIPAEELTLLEIAVDEALLAVRRGQPEAGQQLLCRGLQQSRAWKRERWGNANTRLWIWVLRLFAECVVHHSQIPGCSAEPSSPELGLFPRSLGE